MKNYMKSNNEDKRDFRRIETKLPISLFYDNLVYPGIVSNLSENGMFIITKRRFPVDSMFVTTLIIDDDSIQVPVRIKRAVNSDNIHDAGESGVGVNVLRSSMDYLNFLGKYRTRQLKLTL